MILDDILKSLGELHTFELLIISNKISKILCNKANDVLKKFPVNCSRFLAGKCSVDEEVCVIKNGECGKWSE